MDFYWHTARLIVEPDWGVHKGQVEYDAQHDEPLTRCGLRVLRIPNADVSRDLAAVLARIAAAAHDCEPSMPGER